MNVNFPESAVQRAADDFVRDLYSKPQGEPNVQTPEVPESEKPKQKGPGKPTSQIFKFYLISPAYAQTINTRTTRAEEIKNRMAARVKEITKLKSEGILGETKDGELLLKDPRKAAANLKKIRQLIDDENNDREELYEEIEDANKLSDKNHERIRKIFGKAFQVNSPKGTWIEDPEENWIQKN